MTGAPTSVPGSDPAAAGRPLDERLLDTRAPADYALSPDGRTLVWALHATVDDEGRHFPADLWRSTIDALDAPPTRLTAGRSPAWSPDGSTIAFLSDRITPGHHLPYVLAASGSGEARLVANLRGSAESVSWSGDGRALLVLAADPGSYALDWSARFVTGADGVAPPIRRPADAWRRLFRVDVTTGEANEVGPAGLSVWESTGTAAPRSSPSSPRTPAATAGTTAISRCSISNARSARSIVEPRRIARGRGAVAGWDPRRRGRGLLERSRPARRQRPRDRPRERPHRRPVARPADGRPGVMGR